MTQSEYERVVNKVNELLTENQEWETRFEDYAKDIQKNKDAYNEGLSKFQVNAPLYRYTKVGIVKDNKLEYDIRFCGQSIATISVKKDDVLISTKRESIKYFDDNIPILQLDKENWKSKKSSKFRNAFTEELQKKEKGKSIEHYVENILLAEFKKGKSVDKKLCNIQPVKLCGLFFQLPTPLLASKGFEELKYAKESGGGIDILARVRHKNNSVHLSVMELKDENTSKEPPQKAMEQAIAYSTFLARLLRSKSGNEWYKIFGFKGNIPKVLIIDATIVMPYDKIRNTNFETINEIYVSDKTYIKLYSLYFQRDKNNIQEFAGSLKDDMLPHNPKK